ncbi:MAG TPA: 4-hydroxy-tetrahydrodipicolinate reductase [Verrucomicrobia bacterium]|nr:4-hydroxy-tetrahydrodipicolinate reductase [Verrucomicrobiota bacterium]
MSAAKKILLIGAAGRMGQAIARLLASGAAPGLELAAAVDRADSPLVGQDAGSAASARPLGVRIAADLADALAARPDVAIDFSFHAASAAAAPRMAAAGIPWIVGTTGLDDAETAAIAKAAQQIPVVLSSNMSLGVNLLYALVEQAARALQGRGYDCEIVERHHRRKKDAPSGTALYLGEAAAKGFGWNLKEVAVDGRSGLVGERPEKQIGFHAVRGGDIVGDHTVLFAADGECVELSHRATSRDTLALGALRAAAWIPGRAPALYGMRDVIGLNPGSPA